MASAGSPLVSEFIRSAMLLPELAVHGMLNSVLIVYMLTGPLAFSSWYLSAKHQLLQTEKALDYANFNGQRTHSLLIQLGKMVLCRICARVETDFGEPKEQ